jgi:transaldolase
MKFFLDTASLTEIRDAQAMGILDGVTTNPSLVSKESIESFEAHIRTICEIVEGPVSAEVTATDYEGIMREARHLSSIAENVVVKIPMIPEGVKAIRSCFQDGIRTNCTLVFSTNQALVAAKAGATFVSPFIGRLDDVGHTGMDVIREMVSAFDNYGFDTEVLVASIRHPLHVTEAALAGADIATMPHRVFTQLMSHPLTDVGLARFLSDWEKVKSKRQG